MFMSVDAHVLMLTRVLVEVKGQPWMSSLISSTLFFEADSLTEPGAHQFWGSTSPHPAPNSGVTDTHRALSFFMRTCGV